MDLATRTATAARWNALPNGPRVPIRRSLGGAVARAREAVEREAPLVQQHVGYYLLGAGRGEFQS